MQLQPHWLGRPAVLVIGFTYSLAAHAHGVEMVTPFVIFPALVFGLIGGAYAGSRRIGRIAGLINVLGIFLASLAAMALLLALSEISETGAIILLKAVVLAVILGLLLGVIPLVVGYVISEYIVRRFGRQRDPPTGDEHGA